MPIHEGYVALKMQALGAEVLWKTPCVEPKLDLSKAALENQMRTMMTGFAGWARMTETKNETLRVTDTGITVVGTLLVVVTWALFR